MTGPQKLKPRFFKALDMAADSGVLAGTSFMLAKAFWMVRPPVKDQMKGVKPSADAMSRNSRAPLTVASILPRWRTMPGFFSADSTCGSP